MTVVCRLVVLADYELEDPAVPDIRRSWRVSKVLLERRALVPSRTDAAERVVGPVVGVESIERMRRWADDRGRDHVSYCFSLEGTR